MLKPKDYASALYRALRGKGKKEVDAGVKRLTEALKARGSVRLLPQILAALPKAAFAADADRRVTIESARELGDAETKKILAALGADPDATEVVAKVDEELVGGVRIRKHDGTIDATVKGKLARIKDALMRAE